jgi:hypothetical protein
MEGKNAASDDDSSFVFLSFLYLKDENMNRQNENRRVLYLRLEGHR